MRKQQARTQFETAERMREALNGRPESERTRKDYQKVADAYRKVYYVSPASSKADESIMAVAEILAEMGHQFAPDDKDLHAAIGQYEFLRREYPGSKYRMEALFTIGQIYKEDLGDDAAAKATICRVSEEVSAQPTGSQGTGGAGGAEPAEGQEEDRGGGEGNGRPSDGRRYSDGESW